MKLPADAGGQNGSEGTVDEVTPLLGAATTGRQVNKHVFPSDTNGQVDNGNHGNDTGEEKPMPYAQILIVCYASLAEPTGYFAIFPFISEMIERNGNLDESDIGFWAGLIESLFSIVQMILMIFYGRMSDRYGRKPVLVFSLVGVSVGTALFGFSRNLWQMMLFRCIAGLFAGSVVTTRTILSEITTKRTQGRAFSWYAFTRNLGILIGPLIGGGLANPAIQFPNTFGHNSLFKAYPYAFPTLITGAFTLSGAILCFFTLKETLVYSADGSKPSEPPMSTSEILRTPGVAVVLYTMGHINFLALSYTAISNVFQYTKVHLGGWGLPPNQIAYILALAGTSQAIWVLLVFPPLQRRIGTANVLRCCGVVWPLFMLMYPLINELLRHDLRTLAVSLAVPTVVLGSGVAMSFGKQKSPNKTYGAIVPMMLTEIAAVQLCLNDVSPSPAVLGSVNALGLTGTSGARAVAPALFASIFASGVKIGWADGHLVWFFLVFLAVTSNIPLYFLPAVVEGRVDTHPPNPDAE